MPDLPILGGALLALVTLPGTVELLVLTAAGVLPLRHRQKVLPAGTFRLAIVVPAHNEELNIARCVTSLLAADRFGVELGVIVVADNCDDDTGQAASQAGARVVFRKDDVNRGKGYALNFAFEALGGEPWQAFAVVDADSIVAPNFLTEMVATLKAGADAVQCRYLVRNAGESVRTRLMSLALAAFNVLRPRGRERCRLSAGILGNGFALSAATVRSVPYTATSVVEDLEYHIALLQAGRRVHFVDATAVYGDMPSAGPGVRTQRARWEGGRFRMIVAKTPAMLAQILRGRLVFLEPCLDLLLLPLAFHVTLLSVAGIVSIGPVRNVALFGLAVVVLHLFAAIYVTGGGLREIAALLGAPFYIGWKLLLIPRLFKSSRATSTWVRTERAPKRNLP